MSILVALLIDLACGCLLLGAAFGGVRLLVPDPRWVYLLAPLLSLAAAAFGFWRTRQSGSPRWLAVVLINLPLAGVLVAFAGRQQALLALVVLTTLFTAAGAAVRSRRWLVALVVGANLLLFLAVPRFVSALVHTETVSEAVAPFVLHGLDGRAVTSAQLQGKVVVLDFWATWCIPCRRELPVVDRVANGFGAASAVAFFAVDSAKTDQPGDRADTPLAARQFATQLGATLPLAFSADGTLEGTLNVHGLPTLIVLDRGGRVRWRHVGFVGSEDLAGNLSQLIELLEHEDPDVRPTPS